MGFSGFCRASAGLFRMFGVFGVYRGYRVYRGYGVITCFRVLCGL